MTKIEEKKINVSVYRALTGSACTICQTRMAYSPAIRSPHTLDQPPQFSVRTRSLDRFVFGLFLSLSIRHVLDLPNGYFKTSLLDTYPFPPAGPRPIIPSSHWYSNEMPQSVLFNGVLDFRSGCFVLLRARRKMEPIRRASTRRTRNMAQSICWPFTSSLHDRNVAGVSMHVKNSGGRQNPRRFTPLLFVQENWTWWKKSLHFDKNLLSTSVYNVVLIYSSIGRYCSRFTNKNTTGNGNDTG